MPKANNVKITQEQIDDILDEAQQQEPLSPSAPKLGAAPAGISLANFKTDWSTKYRAVMLTIVSMLTMFGLKTYATYLSRVIVVVDLFVGGQVEG